MDIKLPKSLKVALKASNGKYVSIENGPLQAIGEDKNSATIFDMMPQGTDKIALRAANSRYVCNESNGGQPLIANRDAIGPWETFEVQHVDKAHIALKASNGRIVCNESDGAAPLQANRDKVGPWETFELIIEADLSAIMPEDAKDSEGLGKILDMMRQS